MNRIVAYLFLGSWLLMCVAAMLYQVGYGLPRAEIDMRLLGFVIVSGVIAFLWAKVLARLIRRERVVSGVIAFLWARVRAWYIRPRERKDNGEVFE